MERLTERTTYGIVGNNERVKNYPLYKVAMDDPLDYGITGQCFEKLADYEDLEEQGMLLRLPCKVGDTVWVNGVLGCGEAEEYKVIRVDYHSTLASQKSEFYIEALLVKDGHVVEGAFIGFYDKEFGKTVFLTEAEAESALAEKGE